MLDRRIDRRSFLRRSTALGAAATVFSHEEAALLAYQQGFPPDQRGEGRGRQSYPPPVGAGPMPVGDFAGMKVTRLIFGHDLISGIAHSRDLLYVSGLIRNYFSDAKILDTYQKAQEMGINTQFLRIDERNVRLAKQFRERGGKMQYIAQCVISKDNVKRDADIALECGAKALYIRGNESDRFFQEGTLGDIVPKALEYFRQNKVAAGMAAHLLDAPMLAEKLGVGADFYVKTFNSGQYWSAGPRLTPDPNWKPSEKQLVQPELGVSEWRHDSLWDATPQQTAAFMASIKKPWIAYKVLAAGAIHPKDGFRYAFEHGADFIVAGMYDFQIDEDVKTLKDLFANKFERTRPWYS